MLLTTLRSYQSQNQPQLPMASKDYIIYLFLLIGCCWLLLSSWKDNKESFAVSGKVEAIYGNTANTRIFFTQDEKEKDLSRMKDFDVTSDGDFTAVINILSRGPVYFYVFKKGYTPIRIVETLKDPKRVNDIGTVRIASLVPSSPRYRHIVKKETRPLLPLYEDECLTRLDEQVRFDQIAYFDNLREVENCEDDNRYGVLSARISVDGELGGLAFFKVEKLPDGEAVIVSSSPAPEDAKAKLAVKKK